MMNDDTGPVNRWATEHYGFDDEPAGRDAPGANAATGSADPAPSGHGLPRSGRRGALIAAGVVSLALTAGIGGAAVAASDPPEDRGDGFTHIHEGGGRGDRLGDHS